MVVVNAVSEFHAKALRFAAVANVFEVGWPPSINLNTQRGTRCSNSYLGKTQRTSAFSASLSALCVKLLFSALRYHRARQADLSPEA